MIESQFESEPESNYSNALPEPNLINKELNYCISVVNRNLAQLWGEHNGVAKVAELTTMTSVRLEIDRDAATALVGQVVALYDLVRYEDYIYAPLNCKRQPEINSWV